MRPEYDYLTDKNYLLTIRDLDSGRSIEYHMNYKALVDTNLKEIVDYWRRNYR